MKTPKMSPERKRTLRKLIGMMNTRHRQPFPVTRPLLQCFDAALTQEEAEFLVCLGTTPFTRAQAASLSGLAQEKFNPLFDGLIRKGPISPQHAAEGELFSLAGIMVGWFEVYLSDGEMTAEKREFSRRLDELLKSWGRLNFFPLRILLSRMYSKNPTPAQSVLAAGRAGERISTRTIPVDETVNVEPMKIYPGKTVQELIEKHGAAGNIAVVHCFCRQYHKMIDEPCRFDMPPQSCVVIGPLSHHVARSGVGHLISKDEAAALIRSLQQKGAVHQVFHESEDVDQPELAICNCCWDCCGVLGSYSRAIMPLRLRSYFEAQLSDASLCNACSTCVGYCPVQAITLVDDRASMDSRKCIGCGQCELQCPENAIMLVPNERNVFLPLPRRSQARIPW
jgi:ferredoxin